MARLCDPPQRGIKPPLTFLKQWASPIMGRPYAVALGTHGLVFGADGGDSPIPRRTDRPLSCWRPTARLWRGSAAGETKTGRWKWHRQSQSDPMALCILVIFPAAGFKNSYPSGNRSRCRLLAQSSMWCKIQDYRNTRKRPKFPGFRGKRRKEQILLRVKMFGYLFEERLVFDFLDLRVRCLDIFCSGKIIATPSV